MSALLQPWVEAVVALLLVTSGVLALVAGFGLVRLRDFFQRMHPPALAYTLAAWCVSLATLLYLSLLEARLALHAWLVVIMLTITVPVTTVLLARAAVFRCRQAGDPRMPASLSGNDGKDRR